MNSSTTSHSPLPALLPALLLGLIHAAPLLGSDSIITPEPQTVVSTGYYGLIDHSPEKVVNNSGLERPLNHRDRVPATWPSHDTNLTTMFQSTSEVLPSIVFTLPEACDIHALHYWNLNVPAPAPASSGGGKGLHNLSGGPSGIHGVDILTSQTSPTGPFTKVGSYAFETASGDPSYQGATLNLGTTVRARFVQFIVTSAWAEHGAGLSELRFIGLDREFLGQIATLDPGNRHAQTGGAVTGALRGLRRALR